ncbi:Beta-lactamase-like protein [Thiomonas sp. X19]|uniref:MBL fold metallo-hydrolase n=1 Tax=Thiomonas sp. X19 TaxID=1050370 RepID=UPI000B64D20C|nr:MBL fold metallo-hydrolase [Thiomonas sp. X19]SCC91098.1 Beta-lactamase-like protein [Thiomonas sp. X19]
MKAEKFYSEGQHQWFTVYDQDEPRVIDSNVYALQVDGHTLLCDPGGFEVFSQVFSALVDVLPPSSIEQAFVSHQDPDIASSLPLWNACNPDITWHTPQLWVSFIRHYGALEASIQGIADEGGELAVGSAKLQIIPAHYLHSSANFHLYDPQAKVLFSGDVGAAMLPTGHSAFVDRRDLESASAFDAHIKHATFFHKRWMPSNAAKRNWCERVSKLDIEFLCPQHGAIYTGENVQRFIQWFDALDVGSAVA